MSDDFFSGLDNKLTELKTNEQEAQERERANRAAAEDAIEAMHPVANDFAAKLRERGMSAKVSGSRKGLTFEMRWADNGEHGLSAYPDLSSGRLKLIRTSTDHTDGRRFSSTDGMMYAAGQWSPDRFEAALKSIIEDYIYYAPKHGGIG